MDNFLTTKEAAEMAGVSTATIRLWVKKGYLGDANKQSVTPGSGCGYKIRQSDLNRYIHGWEIDEPASEPVEADTKLIEISDIPTYMKNVETLKLAAANLRIAIEFAQEELSKIEKLL